MNEIVSAAPTRTLSSRPAWRRKSRGCFPVACPNVPQRSPAIPLCGGAAGVGRSAVGRALDEQAITLAVVVSVRHQDTDYDSLLTSGVPRDIARDRIRSDIDRILANWA